VNISILKDVPASGCDEETRKKETSSLRKTRCLHSTGIGSRTRWDYDNATKRLGVSSPLFHESARVTAMNVEEKMRMPNIEVIPCLKLVVQKYIGNVLLRRIPVGFSPSFGGILVFSVF
jgi:hypothetical protein